MNNEQQKWNFRWRELKHSHVNFEDSRTGTNEKIPVFWFFAWLDKKLGHDAGTNNIYCRLKWHDAKLTCPRG